MDNATRKNAVSVSRARVYVVLASLMLAMLLLAARAVYLQVWHADYLQQQGNSRHLRVVADAPNRGMILDRNGEPLAISTPVESIWANPAELAEQRQHWPRLAPMLGITMREFASLVARHQGREFMYLKRHVAPEYAQRVMALGIPGVALQREYRRYYPAGAVAGHVLGFTNIDDRGQEGIELAYDEWLSGVPGKKRVLKDRLGNIVETVESLNLPVPGKDLQLSIDRRVQYLAYRELKAAIATHAARGGTAVVLDVQTGEVLAMVNEPGFNPNNRTQLRGSVFRNRAVTDVFEPGSTLKPFTVAAALESGKFSATTPIDTSPGLLKVGRNTVRDTHDYGRLTVAGVIQKSSNVGTTKIAFAVGKEAMWNMLRKAGFGRETGASLPGESYGLLNPPQRWGQIEQATMSFGYGVSVTPLQLARAYTALANGGQLAPVSLVKRERVPATEGVMSMATALEVRAMLELAVGSDGTGGAARVRHFRVAGKTGTVHKLGDSGYAKEYLSFFAGFAPATRPRLAMVVMIDEPTRGGHFGGEIAAPVFGRVMADALRLLNIPPDAPEIPQRHIARHDDLMVNG